MLGDTNALFNRPKEVDFNSEQVPYRPPICFERERSEGVYMIQYCSVVHMFTYLYHSCSLDNTVSIFENAKDSRSMFKFNSFRFQRLEKVSTVWLHCEVQVCDGEKLFCQPVSINVILLF